MANGTLISPPVPTNPGESASEDDEEMSTSEQEMDETDAGSITTLDEGDGEAQVILPDDNNRLDTVPNYCGSQLITILVGKDKARYCIHKDILVSASPFFSKCLASGMKETETNTIELPEENCRFFNAFSSWMYDGTVKKIRDNDDLDQAIREWVLAEKYLVPKWQNVLVDAMIDFWQECYLDLRYVRWARTEDNRHLLLSELIMNTFAYEMATGSAWYQERESEMNALVEKGLVSTVELIRFATNELWTDPNGDRCAYHSHQEGENCETAVPPKYRMVRMEDESD
ncbi:hypothetical protein H2200_011873 [Cladophialophora chaetospira]|uniref:BTB domain-containing protein n=1 Tax=Cladophialophora chaetospira TaxID=386627 RepID=A0AA38WYV4_9EURO|nr:hypothetical protein H2200_011873 [Cladophialophora chaetospira]